MKLPKAEKRRRLLLTVIGTALFCLSLPVVSVFGQEIFKEAGSMYSTGELTSKFDKLTGKNCTVRSATTLRGFLKIIAADQPGVTLRYFKRAKTDSKTRALDYIDLISVGLVRTIDGVRLELRGPNPPPWTQSEAGTVEVELVLPLDMTVDIDATYFDIEAEGPFNGFKVVSSLGRIDLLDAHGSIQIATSNRAVILEKISGEIDIATTNATLEVINVRSSSTAARFSNDGGSITIADAFGSLDIQNAFGRIDIERFTADKNRSYIRGASEPITIELLKTEGGQLIVSNRYEDVDIQVPSDISSQFTLSVERGAKIEVVGLKFQPDMVTKSRLSITSGAGEALVRATVRGQGNVFIRGSDDD